MDNQNEKPQATASQARPFAWIATDMDGRADVGITKEIAKQRAGEGCTEFIPLYDLPDVVPGSAHRAQQRADGDERDLEGALKMVKQSNDILAAALAQSQERAEKLAAELAAQRADSTLPVVPTWKERCGDTGPMPSRDEAITAMGAEIADLRAALQQAASQPAAAAQGEDAKDTALRDWANAERIAAVPIVEDAIRGFSEDPTGNNGVCVVLAVLDAAMQANKQEKA